MQPTRWQRCRTKDTVGYPSAWARHPEQCILIDAIFLDIIVINIFMILHMIIITGFIIWGVTTWSFTRSTSPPPSWSSLSSTQATSRPPLWSSWSSTQGTSRLPHRPHRAALEHRSSPRWVGWSGCFAFGISILYISGFIASDIATFCHIAISVEKKATRCVSWICPESSQRSWGTVGPLNLWRW